MTPRLAACALAPLTILLACGARASAGRDWPEYLGGPERSHYSSLGQINTSNVGRLRVAWEFHSGDFGQMQCNPLIVAGVLYGATATSQIFALDAATGRQLWRFSDPRNVNEFDNDRASRAYSQGPIVHRIRGEPADPVHDRPLAVRSRRPVVVELVHVPGVGEPPELPAGRRVQREYLARRRRPVQHPGDDERVALHLAEVARVEFPGDPEPPHVGGVDLPQGRVVAALGAAEVFGPVAPCRGAGAAGQKDRQRGQGAGRQSGSH